MRKLIGLFILLISTCAFAQIPNVISYQGILLNQPTGEPVANGPHNVKFRVYDAPTGGNFQWETGSIEVNTFKGLFTTLIQVPADGNWSQALYVEVVADGVETGRIQLTTVPYAFRANTAIAMDASGLTGTVNDARLTEHLQDLADGSLSGSKVGDGIPAANLIGTINDSRLTTHLQDLADGTLSGSKVGSGIAADNVTTGTLPAAVMPAGSVSGTGTAGLLAYWTAANQLAASGLTWEAVDSEVGIGNAAPNASLAITHTATHPLGTALAIENTWNQAGAKTGVNISLSANGAGSIYGINTQVAASGTGSRVGVSASASSDAANANAIYGVAGYADGQGTGDHRGVFGQASATNTTEQTGVFGEASGNTGIQNGVVGSSIGPGGVKHGVRGIAGGGSTSSKFAVKGEATGGGLINYAVYGIASGAAINYGIYSSGNLHTAGNITYTGSISQGSDRKLKRNILPLSNSLDKLLQLKPSTYYFRTTEFSSMNLSEGKQIGLIAQDVEKIFPELVSLQVNTAVEDSQGKVSSPEVQYKSVDYVSLIPVLIRGMQEQQAMIDELKQEIKRMKDDQQQQNVNSRMVKASSK